MQKRAQASIEYLIVVGIILMITIPIFYYSFHTSSQRIRLNQATDAINALAKTANTVYTIGPETKQYVWITMPSGIESVSTQNNEILIKLQIFSGTSDIYAKTITAISVDSVIPINKGTYKISIEALDSGEVRIS